MPNHINRTTRLEQDYKALKSFCEQNDSRIRIIAMDRKMPPEWYDIVVNVISLVGVKDLNYYSEYPVYGESFSFRVELNQYYPNKPPIIQTIKGDSLTPFHPHFEVHYDGLLEKFKKEPKTWATWISPFRYDSIEQTLEIYLCQMIRSLQYHDSFLATIVEYQHGRGIGEVANEDAARYYNRNQNADKRLKNTPIFPTDNFLLEEISEQTPSNPNRLPIAIPQPQNIKFPKKFDIQVPPKTFNINNNANIVVNVKKSFVVQEQSAPFAPPEWSIKDFLSRNERDYQYEANSDRWAANPNYQLFFTEFARKEVWKHIGFDHPTMLNEAEQGGLMLGKVFKDSEENKIFVVVKNIIKAKEAAGTPMTLEMSHQVWQQMMREYDEYVRHSDETDLRIVGWYHTHPNDLDVFMSPTDKGTQSMFFKEAWQFAVVLNPHRKIWKVFQGKDSRECLGFCLRSVPLEINASNGDDTLFLDMSNEVNMGNSNE